MNYKCAIFDFGGVCFTNGTNATIETYQKKYNVPPQVSFNVLNGEDSSLLRMGKVDSVTFWNKQKVIMGLDAIPWQTLQEIWDTSYKPNYNVLKLIDEIRMTGHRVLYLSDNTKCRMDYLERKYEINKFFDDGILSYKEGIRKPNILLYEKVLTLAEVQPNECVYIDDKAEFLLPAKKLGMKVIHFRTIKDLHTLNLLSEEDVLKL